MTDIFTNAAITIRRLALPRLSFPKSAIGVSLSALPIAIGEALTMVYVGPHANRREPQAFPDQDLEGRDPDW